MKLPKHIFITIEHQPHAVMYQTVEEWLERNDKDGCADVADDDRIVMLETGDVWFVQWYPHTPIGFSAVAASSLEKALELAAEIESENEQ